MTTISMRPVARYLCQLTRDAGAYTHVVDLPIAFTDGVDYPVHDPGEHLHRPRWVRSLSSAVGIGLACVCLRPGLHGRSTSCTSTVDASSTLPSFGQQGFCSLRHLFVSLLTVDFDSWPHDRCLDVWRRDGIYTQVASSRTLGELLAWTAPR